MAAPTALSSPDGARREGCARRRPRFRPRRRKSDICHAPRLARPLRTVPAKGYEQGTRSTAAMPLALHRRNVSAAFGLSAAMVERNLREVGLGQPGERASSLGHSARQPPQLVLYARKHLFGWESPARSPTLLDCPTNVFDTELARLCVLVAMDEVAHVIADARVLAAFDRVAAPIPASSLEPICSSKPCGAPGR